MRIRYPTYPEKSRFIVPCEEAICQSRNALREGIPITVQFSAKGRDGRIRVEISESDDSTFGTDWDYRDESQFPRRIRAAAYALFSTGCFGSFEITHDRNTGRLTISQA